MNAIGRYLLFLISIAGMILSDDPFTEKNKKKFLDHIFQSHNRLRFEHGVPLLRRNESMDKEAHEILKKRFFEHIYQIPAEYGMNIHFDIYNNDTKLSPTKAHVIFIKWYRERSSNNDPTVQQMNKIEAAKHIVWNKTQTIGLAIEQKNFYYAVLALYYPRYKLSTQGQFASNDQAGHSTV